MNSEPPLLPARESLESILAKNLVVARVVLGMTQQELATKADVSRATIAQIETGYSDPRLSTLSDLASAIGIPLLLLLAGRQEVAALIALIEQNSASQCEIPPSDVDRMQRLISTGMLKDRVRAARIGAAVARSLGKTNDLTQSAVGILSAIQPGVGTAAGLLIAEKFGVMDSYHPS